MPVRTQDARITPMIPVYVFYSMFGFQRTGDSIWAAADQLTRGFLIGATAGSVAAPENGFRMTCQSILPKRWRWWLVSILKNARGDHLKFCWMDNASVKV